MLWLSLASAVAQHSAAQRSAARFGTAQHDVVQCSTGMKSKGVQVGDSMFDSFDLENLQRAALLLQTGYLTGEHTGR